MSDRPDDPESGAGEPKPPKIKAEDNPWYLLATLYGVPDGDRELTDKNRVAWNRYFAVNLDAGTRTKLIEEKRHPAEELTPFSPKELRQVATAFAARCKASATKLALPVVSGTTHDIHLAGVEFEQDVYFDDYLFGGSANFDGATFGEGASFDGATFGEEASFDGATFLGFTDFSDATFLGGAKFSAATFLDVAAFDNSTFSRTASFYGATFSGLALFTGATFDLKLPFISILGVASFVNAEMKGETSFEGAKFKREPPKFFGAKLHQGTVWRAIAWPPLPKSKHEAGQFIDAYACLKLEMDRLKKHEDELDFFALELQSRRVLLGPWRGLPIWLYGVLSNYGRSYLRPLAWLFVIAVACAPVFRHFGAKAPIDSLGLSLANLLSVFGFRKDFNLSIDSLPVALKILAATQTIVGGALLFLFGLGVRNKFRMK